MSVAEKSSAGRVVDALVARLRADEGLRAWPLGTLMPGLHAVPTPLRGCLAARVANALRRGGVRSWSDLATESSESLLLLPNFGPDSLGEVFSAAAREWARLVLHGDSGDPGVAEREEAPAPGPPPAGDLAEAFDALESNTPSFEIFKRRALRERPPSLRELGAELGLSAERVRQRQHAVEEALAERMQDPRWPPRAAAERISGELGSLAPSRRLPGLFAELDAEGRAFAPPHRRALLLSLAGYALGGEWVFCADLERRTDALLEDLTARGPVSLAQCFSALDALDVPGDLKLPWIESRPGVRVSGDLVARRSQAIDVAVAVLSAAKEPLELEELFERTAPPFSLASFRSHIQHDGRFTRQGVRTYGLSEWHREAYTNLAEKMLEEIDRHGGAMELDLLVRSLVEKFGVAEGSVAHRARSPQFEVDSRGRISRRAAPRIVPPTTLALTHGCFRLEAGWAMKRAVTRSLLAGATVRTPLAFARELGLQFGTSRTIDSAVGELHAYWPRYESSVAHLSSLRAVAEELGAEVGDDLFAIHSGSGWLDFRLIERRQCENASGMACLALECGREPGEAPTRQVLAALGFDPALPNAEAAIRGRLEARHERRLANRLPERAG